MQPKSASETIDELPPAADEAYQRYLRGASQRAIAHALNLDRATVKRYIDLLHREQMQRIRAKRQRLLSEAVARLRHVQEHAWGQLSADAGNVAALNTVVAAEREAAKLQGLYDAASDEDSRYDVLITITKRGTTVKQRGAEAADGDEN